MNHVIYLDVETTGLDWRKHQMCEIAWARETGVVSRFVPKHSLHDADPDALAYNGYVRRKLAYASEYSLDGESSGVVDNMYDALIGATVVSLSANMHTRFLSQTVRFRDEPWDYRLIDLPLYAAGIFGWDEPRSIGATFRHVQSLGFDIVMPKHEAARDCQAARELHMVLRKLAEVRRFVDEAVVAHNILSANTEDPHDEALAMRLVVGDVWKTGFVKPRRY